MHANWVLHSAKPWHVVPIDQSPAKNLMMVIKAKGAHVEFRLDEHGVQIIVAVTFTVYSS